MKIYLLHYKALKERILPLIDRLLACETVEDIELITSETSKVKFSTYEENRKVLPADWPMRVTTTLEQSVYHKHYRAFEKIASGGQPAIVLEDDAIFDPKKFDEFVRNCATAPADLDWCFFGTGLKMTIPGKGFVKHTGRLKSKCADSMFINHKAAKIIYDDLSSDKVYAAIDWDLNYRFLKHNFNVYWYEPGIVVQGSENGVYKCSHQR